MTKTKTLSLKPDKPSDTVNEAPKQEQDNSLFGRITTSKTPAPRRILLYGVQGVGKSTWASCAPKPIFLPTEEGLNDIKTAKFPLLESLADVMDAIKDLYQRDHGFKTVVIDSLDWLEAMIWDVVRQEEGQKIFEDYGKGYSHAVSKWRVLIAACDALRKKGLSVIFLAHSKIEHFEDPESKSYDRFVPRLHKTAAAVIQEWCDEVLFACFRTYTTDTKEGFGRERSQGIGSGERIMRTSERPFCMAKSRLNLPFEIPLTWEDYAKYLVN